MPELPEVETLKNQLSQVLINKTISSIKVLRPKSFQGIPQDLINQTITSINRKAKIIIIKFKTQFPKLLIHLKMTGQLIYISDKKRIIGGHPTSDWINDLPSSHTRAIIKFTDKTILYFNDMRVFGWLKVINSQNQFNQEFKNYSQIEPLTPQFTIKSFTQILKTSSQTIKLFLLNQSKIAGLGNIYVNDALFDAKINPFKQAKRLSKSEIAKLHQSINKVISAGIKFKGASESTYKHLDGLGGTYQKHFLIYKKEGKPCLQCGSIIKRIKQNGRSTFFCPKCQN
jgi:formamidopyrimidine-DNA glycosylase